MSFYHTHRFPKPCFYPFFFFSILAAFLWASTILSDVVFSFPVCVPPSVVRKQTHFFWGGKLQFLPKIILSHFFFFCPDLSRHFNLLRFFFFPFCSSPLVSPQFIPLVFREQIWIYYLNCFDLLFKVLPGTNLDLSFKLIYSSSWDRAVPGGKGLCGWI